MHPDDCPTWEYDDHPHRQAVLRREVKSVLLGLRQGHIDSQEIAADTRTVHQLLFQDLTPPGHSYYAGHYRGEGFRCLRYNQVGIQSDRRVGYPPSSIPLCMMDLARIVRGSVASLDAGFLEPDVRFSLADKLLFAVALVCRIFEEFLRIHPYVNGNGHAARFVIWAILGRYGFWPTRFPIEPRPSDPPYTDCIVAYRNGSVEPLEQFVLQCLDQQQ